MFIYNVKLNSNKLIKILLVILAIIVLCIAAVTMYRFISSVDTNKDNACVPSDDIQISTTRELH